MGPLESRGRQTLKVLETFRVWRNHLRHPIICGNLRFRPRNSQSAALSAAAPVARSPKAIPVLRGEGRSSAAGTVRKKKQAKTLRTQTTKPTRNTS